MIFIYVEVQRQSGATHPALLNIIRTQDAQKLCNRLKFLCGDYLTDERLALKHGSNPKCKLCPAPIESIKHVLTECRATNGDSDLVYTHDNMYANSSNPEFQNYSLKTLEMRFVQSFVSRVGNRDFRRKYKGNF